MTPQESINKWFSEFEHNMHVHVPNIVAETVVEFSQNKFKTQEWDGVPWQPLNPNYARRKTRGKGKILTRTGALMLSIRPSEVAYNRVVVSAGNSKVPYARMHNEGGRVRGTRKVRSYTNRNFMGRGKPVQIKAHTRTVNYGMPKRQYLGHSHYQNQIIKDRLINYFKSL